MGKVLVWIWSDERLVERKYSGWLDGRWVECKYSGWSDERLVE